MAKDYNYNKALDYKSEQDDYVVQLKKRNWKWLWLLLLLLPLLLLIRCERDIEVITVDADSHEAIADVEVTIDYTSHFLYKDGKFLYDEDINRSGTTDTEGKYKFTKLPCSVFSYIFYAFSKVTYTSGDECCLQVPSPDTSLFHFTWHKKLTLMQKREDVTITVIDRETREVLAGAKVEYKYDVMGKEVSDSVKTSANGRCTIKDVPACGDLLLTRVSCYGFVDTTNVTISVPDAITKPDSTIVELTPVKQRISFFVKNKFTKEPVPEATVDVTLTTSGGKVSRGSSTTNVDGKGYGEYGDAFILADLKLHASKDNYKDGWYERAVTVEQFNALPDSLRVIYLEPEPTMREFQNVDSITGKPIPGVTNEITIKSISGKSETRTETSNTNGIFYINALDGDEIIIHSEHSPYYEPKDTHIPALKDGEKIKMKPVTVDLTFRTIDEDTGLLLPDCELKISSTETKVSTPTSSGTGEFTVKGLLASERISITASKTDYGKNDTKVRDVSVLELSKSPQERRDIPLAKRKKFSADIVMCIDCTSSMSGILNTIKSNAMNFYPDLVKKCEEQNKEVTDMRIRVIGFRDFDDITPFEKSDFFNIPAADSQFRAFVGRLMPIGGGDLPERGYNALCEAINSDWHKAPDVHQVIILWTDAESHPLTPIYGGPSTMDELKAKWEGDMDTYYKHLIIYAPNTPTWTTLEHGWKNTMRHDVKSGGGLSDVDYDEILNEISSKI